MIKVDLHNRPMYEYRCDERLKGKDEESTRLTYTGTETPKDRELFIIRGKSRTTEIIPIDGCRYNERLNSKLERRDLNSSDTLGSGGRNNSKTSSGCTGHGGGTTLVGSGQT